MESAQKWEYANRITGNLCALFAAVASILAIVLLVVKIDGRLALLSFFFFSFLSVAAILALPVLLSKNWIRASFYPKRLEAETLYGLRFCSPHQPPHRRRAGDKAHQVGAQRGGRGVAAF